MRASDNGHVDEDRSLTIGTKTGSVRPFIKENRDCPMAKLRLQWLHLSC